MRTVLFVVTELRKNSANLKLFFKEYILANEQIVFHSLYLMFTG